MLNPSDVFRASVQSDRSGSSLSTSPYRYDEVSLSSNFSKPVSLVRSEQQLPVKQDKPENFFSGFSFSSPLGLLSMKLLFSTLVMVYSVNVSPVGIIIYTASQQ